VSHTYGDERIVEWLRENGYHPRSPAHGSASCLFLLDDLLHESEAFAEAARNGALVYQEDYTVGEGQSRWNTDLVVGPPAEDVDVQMEFGDGNRPIAEEELASVWLAIDAKSVMTEHGKARRNRQRDINSFADIMHHHHPGAVTGGVLLINMADRFHSPLRDEDDITEHDRIEQLVEGTVEIFGDIDRADGKISPNVDGVGCVVVDHTNMDDGEETGLVTAPPAPQPGEIVYYRDFLRILIDTVESRFLHGDGVDIEHALDGERLSERLRRGTLRLSHLSYLLGEELESNEAEPDHLEEMRGELEELDAILDEIDNLA
jgi:hypothetical protein